MSILSKLFDVLKKIIKTIVDFVKKFIKKYWWVLLIVAAIYFAPFLATYFASSGLTTLSTFFGSIATNITSTVVSALDWAWSGASALGSAGLTAFKGAELSTQLAIVGGASALLAPEETADLITEVGSTVFDAVANVGDAILGAFPGWVWVAAAGVGLYLLWPSKRSEPQTVYLENGGLANGR